MEYFVSDIDNMFRALTQVASTSLRAASKSNVARPALVSQVRLMSGGKVESDAEFDARYIAYFDRKDIDGWEIRKVGMGIYFLHSLLFINDCREWLTWSPWILSQNPPSLLQLSEHVAESMTSL